MKVLLLASVLGCASAQTPDIHEILWRVASNQAKAQDARRLFVYHQKQLVRLRRGDSQLAREERREYRVSPAARGVSKDLIAFDGSYEKNGKYISYEHPGYEHKSLDIDAGLVEDLSDDLTGDRNSRDGLANDLFPLTYHQQLKYNFRLAGLETYRGRRVYRVAFDPRQDAVWSGEALIDAEEYQPVFITTKMAHALPLFVRTVFGTNLKGLGFSVSYEKFDDGVWFPVSYGGEFELRAVFFYKRTISISMKNSDFRRADVTSDVTYLADEP